MSKGRLRSLEKCFLEKEIVRWRRKIKGKKKIDSVNGEKKKDEEGSKSKKKKERQAKVGGKNSAPTLKTQQVAE